MITIEEILSQDISPTLKNILIYLRINSKDGICELTNKEIAEDLSFDIMKVRRLILRLKKLKYLSIQSLNRKRFLTINCLVAEKTSKVKDIITFSKKFT